MGVHGTPCITLLPNNTREGVRGGLEVAVGGTPGGWRGGPGSKVVERERDVREAERGRDGARFRERGRLIRV